MVVQLKVFQTEKKENMNLRNKIKVLFVSLLSLLMVEQSFAQKSDSMIVNLGYGITQSSDELSAAVGVATAEELDNFFAINPENALFGQIPGLTVLQNGGNWWSQSAGMYVRGQSNLDNTSAPLILIDGFERDLSTITVTDIQSVSVLKDAASTALYGQRGANGVILVTTKRGIDDGLQVDISYERSVNTPFRMPQMLDAYGYANAMNEALALDGKDYLYSKEQLDAYKDGTYPDYYPNVNWFDEVLRSTGFVNDLNATFKGGKNKTKYYVSMNYLGGEGLLKQDRNTKDYSTQLDYSRANIRTNLDIELTKTTMLKFNLSGRISGTNRPGRATADNLFSNLYGTPANAHPVQYADGTWGGTSVYSQNPVAEVNGTGYASSQERTFYTDLTLTQDLSKILEGLSFSAAISFDNSVDYWDSKTKDFTYDYRTAAIDEINGVLYNMTSTSFGEATDLSFSTSFGGQSRYQNEIIRLNYDKQWGKNSLNVMGLFHKEESDAVGINTTFHRINNAAYIHYAFDKKYFADLTMSYSGNNIMPENDYFRFYPAVSAGWMLSNESFLSESASVNMLKLRASVGLVGLEPNKPYLQVPMYSNGQNYYFQDNNSSTGGLEEDRRANPYIEPEKGLIANFGVDARLFDNLSLNVDVFYEKRSQILVSESASTSNVIGVPSTFVADGIVENRGVEIGALWNQNIGDFNFALGAQYSFARNKILEQNEIFREWDYLQRTGLPVDQVFGLQDDGFWGESDGLNGLDNISPDGVEYTFSQVLKPGDVKYVDQNGDNIINEFDVISIGHNWLPEMYYSFTVNAEYKGIGLSALFQGASNVSVNLNTVGIFWPLYNNNNISTFSNDRWTPATASTATLPRLTPEKNDNNYRNSTIWQRDASFLKLRTLELYYNLPESFVNKAKLERARVFARGMNLFSIDNIEIMDPEVLGTSYPTLKSFNVGLSIGF
jgi:TonB-linked SusC/RagA family outer membrane protein